jgi:hypothetical protein
MEEMRTAYKIFCRGNPNGRDHLEDTGVDGEERLGFCVIKILKATCQFHYIPPLEKSSEPSYLFRSNVVW